MDFSSYKADSKLGLPANRTSNVRVSNPGADALAREQAKTGAIVLQGIDRLRAEVQTGRVMQANNEYNKEMMDLTNELRQNKEQDALNTVEQFDEREQKIRSRIQKKYGSYLYGEAGRKYNDMLTRDYNTRRQSMINYQIGEAEKFNDTVLKNGLTDVTNLATSDYMNPENVDGAMNKAAYLVAQRYEHYGEEKIKQMTRAAQGSMAEILMATAISKNDMTGAEAILNRYGAFVSPDKILKYTRAIQQYKKDNYAVAKTQNLYAKYGKNMRGAFAEIEKSGDVVFPVSGSIADQAMAAAAYVEQKTGIPAAIIYGQWVHETAYQGKAFNSPLARENLNLGGLTQVEPNGEENRQRDGGTNYYKMYKSVREFAEDYVNSFLNRYDFTGVTIKTPEDWARFLKKQGYYTGYGDSEEEKIAGYAAGIASGMKLFNPGAVKIVGNDPVSIQKQKEDYLARINLENRIEAAEKDAAFDGALQEFYTVGSAADPQVIARKYGGTNVILTQTIADRLSKMKYGDGKTDRGPVAMDSIATMLMQDETFNSKTDLVAYMQNNRFSNKEIEKAMKWFDQRKAGEGIFAYPHLDEYISAQLQAENNKGNVARKIELREFANDFINAFRADNKRNPTPQELQDALSEKVTSTKIVIQSDGGQNVSFTPTELSKRGIVSADTTSVPGMVRVRFREYSKDYRGKEVLIPFNEFSQLIGQEVGNSWLQTIGDGLQSVFGSNEVGD